MTQKTVDGVLINLCPGCEEFVPADKVYSFIDARKRPWHEKCAKKALSENFRTPLSPVEASAAVDFACETKQFIAPCSFHLREIVFEEDVEIALIHIGATVITCAWAGATIRSKDFGGKIAIDHDVHGAFPVGVTCTKEGEDGPANSFKWRLLGERRPENGRPRPSARGAIAVAMLKSDADVMPGEAVDLSFGMAAKFRGERLVCDNWKNWSVNGIRVGVDPGSLAPQESPLPLEGVSTPLPTFTARPCERVTYRPQNFAKAPRRFDGRAYGTASW